MTISMNAKTHMLIIVMLMLNVEIQWDLSHVLVYLDIVAMELCVAM